MQHLLSPVRMVCLAGLMLLCGLSTAPSAAQQRQPNPAFDEVKDDPALPRVLLIGDSISIGYTVEVRKLLKGEANVHRIPINGGPTTRGLEQIDKWLGDGRWDVIHFNWGLHDLKYCDDTGKLVPVDQGKQQIPLDEYRENLDKLVQRLKQTDAVLIWASTTPVPQGAVGRVPGDEVTYNRTAREVMEKHGVHINDLYAFAKPRLEELQRPADVHFTEKGSAKLAKQVVQAIVTLLPSK